MAAYSKTMRWLHTRRICLEWPGCELRSCWNV